MVKTPDFQQYESLCNYIENKKGCTRDLPFDFDTLAFRVGKKIFVLMSWQDDPVVISVKNDPVGSVTLRNTYSSITPGYHLNKKHWNTIVCDGSVPDEVVAEMIDESYRLVFASISAEIRKLIID